MCESPLTFYAALDSASLPKAWKTTATAAKIVQFFWCRNSHPRDAAGTYLLRAVPRASLTQAEAPAGHRVREAQIVTKWTAQKDAPFGDVGPEPHNRCVVQLDASELESLRPQHVHGTKLDGWTTWIHDALASPSGRKSVRSPATAVGSAEWSRRAGQ